MTEPKPGPKRDLLPLNRFTFAEMFNSTLLFMIRLRVNFLTISAICFLFTGTSCRAPLNEDNLERLADLENMVSSAQDNLSWDDEDLQKRVDSMEIKLKYLKQAVKDSGETRDALIRYEAIAANYKIYIDQDPVLEYDLDKYRQEIMKLREQALAGKITNQAFEKKYSELRPSLGALHKITEDLWYKVLTVEPDFNRYDKILNEKYEAMGGR